MATVLPYSFDRIVSRRRVATTQDPFDTFDGGTETTTETAGIWAKRMDVRPTDQTVTDTGRFFTNHPARYIVRAGVTSPEWDAEDRIIDATNGRDETFQVTGITVLGRAEYLELYAEANT